ncbi:DUF4303 domain-containing protein [Clostridiaceae bacterium]|nr:DUF4303 domain-containing protein [Clostridiaceae bacterium]
MFDYEKFEHAILGQMTAVFNKWAEEKEDLYIFSLDCTRNLESIGVIGNTISYLEEQAEEDSEDYWYYKYCEEEWELFDMFEAVSADMGRYLEEQKTRFPIQKPLHIPMHLTHILTKSSTIANMHSSVSGRP